MEEKKKEVKAPWEWKKEKWFTLAMIGIASMVFFLSRVTEISLGTKLYLGSIPVLLLILLGIANIATKKNKEVEEGEKVKDDKERKESLVDEVKFVVAAEGLQKNQPITIQLLKDGHVIDSKQLAASGTSRAASKDLNCRPALRIWRPNLWWGRMKLAAILFRFG